MIDIVDQTRSPKYSKKDVTEMTLKMVPYLEDISSGIPGAAMAYDMFKQETWNAKHKYLEVCRLLFTPLVLCCLLTMWLVTQHVKICKAWSSAILAKCVATFKASIPKYCDRSVLALSTVPDLFKY